MRAAAENVRGPRFVMRNEGRLTPNGDYQTATRSSGFRYIASPGFTPNVV